MKQTPGSNLEVLGRRVASYVFSELTSWQSRGNVQTGGSDDVAFCQKNVVNGDVSSFLLKKKRKTSGS